MNFSRLKNFEDSPMMNSKYSPRDSREFPQESFQRSVSMKLLKGVGLVFALSVVAIACGGRNANVDATPPAPVEQVSGDDTQQIATEITSEEQTLGLDSKCICGKYVLGGCPGKYKNIKCVNKNGIIATGLLGSSPVFWMKR
jgi:hypothetical protein